MFVCGMVNETKKCLFLLGGMVLFPQTNLCLEHRNLRFSKAYTIGLEGSGTHRTDDETFLSRNGASIYPMGIRQVGTSSRSRKTHRKT